MLAKTYIFSLSYLLLTGTAWSQLAVFGDLYVSKNNQLHIAFYETYFNGGKIITDNTSVPEAVVSFGPQSDWKQLKKDSYIAGTVRIYHTATFTFPVGSENFFSPITLEVLKNSSFIQTKYTGTPPYLFTQLDADFEIPLYHYWSWKTQGEAIGRIRTYWWEYHRLDRLSFNPIDPSDLYLGLYINSAWYTVLGHQSSNPFTTDLPLSIASGSTLLLEPVNLATVKGVSFTIPKINRLFTEKIVSQVISPNNDGINDTWKIEGYIFSSASKIKVYGLNGNLVFMHQGEYLNNWDGSDEKNGERLPQGSYFYTIDFDGNQTVDTEGWILIKYQ